VESFTDNLNDLSCADTGTYDLVVDSAGFSGSYVQRGACRINGQILDNADRGLITEGRVVGRHIYFNAPGCSYDGLIRPDDEKHVAGDLICSASDGFTTYHAAGTWSASR